MALRSVVCRTFSCALNLYKLSLGAFHFVFTFHCGSRVGANAIAGRGLGVHPRLFGLRTYGW